MAKKQRGSKDIFGRRVPKVIKSDNKRKPRSQRENPHLSQGSPDRYHMSVLNSKLNDAMARISALEWEKNNLERNVASMTETIKKLNHNLNYYKNKVSDYDSELKSMESKMNKGTSSVDREVKNTLIRYESQILTNEETILNQREEIKKLKSQLDALKSGDAKVNDNGEVVKKSHLIADDLLLDILTYYEDIKRVVESDYDSAKVFDDNRVTIGKVEEVINKLKEEQGGIASQVLVSNLNDVVEYLKEASYYSRSKQNLKESMKSTLKEIEKDLKDLGVEEIPTVGTKFDSKKHVEILSEDNDEFGDGDVIDEISKGYAVRGIIVKPANVKVCRK